MKNRIELTMKKTGFISWGFIFMLSAALSCLSGNVLAQSAQPVKPANTVSPPAAVKDNNTLPPDTKTQEKKPGEINADLLNKANELFKAGNYEEALKAYSEAAGGNPDNPVINYNIGNVLYKTGKMEPAIQKYKSAESINRSLYNTGNSLYRMQKLQESLAAYRQALIKNPNDPDAKFNYEFVKKKLEEQQKQQGQDNKNQDQQNKDQNKDQNQDQQNKDQNKDQQDKDKKDNKGSQDQQKSKQDQKQDKKQDKKEQQQDKKRIDPKQAQSMLQELQEKEKELMKKMIEAQKVKASRTKKDW